MAQTTRKFFLFLLGTAGFIGLGGIQATAFASEADLHIPELNTAYTIFGMNVTGSGLLLAGMGVAVLGMIFGLIEFMRIKALPAHKSMLEVSHLIYETCKTYLFQQGKLWWCSRPSSAPASSTTSWCSSTWSCHACC